jgi:hypothetical protein
VSDEDASAVSPPFDERPAEPAAEAQPVAPPRAEVAEPAAQEAPKRRSTIREPASLRDSGPSGPSPTLPPPQPVISSTAAEESGTPKRGWWAKRFSGDKS